MTIGHDNKFCGKIMLGAVEGTVIRIGDDNLFSSEIYIATTDSHSILDSNSGKRINPSKSITIGNHNWIGHRAMILKGVSIGSSTIVGAGAVVSNSPENDNCVVAGCPAKILRQNIDWNFKRI